MHIVYSTIHAHRHPVTSESRDTIALNHRGACVSAQAHCTLFAERYGLFVYQTRRPRTHSPCRYTAIVRCWQLVSAQVPCAERHLLVVEHWPLLPATAHDYIVSSMADLLEAIVHRISGAHDASL